MGFKERSVRPISANPPHFSPARIRLETINPPASVLSTSFLSSPPVIPAPCLRHSRVGGNPRPQSAIYDLRSTIPNSVIPAPQSRHSREGGNPSSAPVIPAPPPSFPRRRESIPGLAFDKTEPAYYPRPMATIRNTKYETTAQGDAPHMLQSTISNLRSAIPNPPCPQLAIDRIRQNPYGNSCACARTL